MRFAMAPRSGRSSRAAAAERKPRCETDDSPGLRYATSFIVLLEQLMACFLLVTGRSGTRNIKYASIRGSPQRRDPEWLCSTRGEV